MAKRSLHREWMADNKKSKGFVDFPERLKMVRNKYGESQKDFAKRFGVATNMISRWESGQYKMSYAAIWVILMELDMLKD